jgi:hypothetical protein
MSSFPWLFKWLAWMVGNGHHICLGTDLFLGGDACFFLSAPLLHVLNSKGLFILAQVFSFFPFDVSRGHWLSATKLQLQGPLTSQWDNFLNMMFHSGIGLSSATD